MDKISLEWFFQIPGLFITIGVLLILIALLVLIIGSSKSRKHTDEELPVVEEPAITPTAPVNVIENNLNNQTEPVNIVDNNLNNQTVLTNENLVNNQLNSNVLNTNLNNNVSDVSNTPVNDNISVSQHDNIMPVGQNSINIVTPVNITEDVQQPVVEETVLTPIEPVTLTTEPVIETPSVLNNQTLINNTQEEIMPTVAPVFSEPEVLKKTEETFNIQEPITSSEPAAEPVVVENNFDSNLVLPIVEPIVPQKIQEQPVLPTNVPESTIEPVTQQVNVMPTEPINNEIEEIL